VLLLLPFHIRVAETNYPNIHLALSHFLQEVRFELLIAIGTLRAPSDVRECNLLHGYECYSVFGGSCFIVYQYSETNLMHFLFSLLRIKGLYIFRALLARPHEALHKRQLV
jgi:hypothetical protein